MSRFGSALKTRRVHQGATNDHLTNAAQNGSDYNDKTEQTLDEDDEHLNDIE